MTAEADAAVRCWWCGVEPDVLIDITTMGDPHPRYHPNWSPGGHDHAVSPPSPGQLLAAGAQAFDRIMDDL